MMETFLVPNNLNGHGFASAMITTVQYLSEGTFAQGVDHLVPVCEMILVDNKIVASVIVITMIVGRVVASCRFLVASCPDVVDIGIVQHFLSFKV